MFPRGEDHPREGERDALGPVKKAQAYLCRKGQLAVGS